MLISKRGEIGMKKILVLTVAFLFILSFISADVSYAKSKKKATPSLKGPKKTIAVMDFVNKAGRQAKHNFGDSMSEMLTTALIKTDRFIVVERQAISDVLQEQDFGVSGRAREAGAAKLGAMLNAQILIRGAITEFETKTSGGSGGIGFAGVSLGGKSKKAHIAVNIKLYDVTTGEVIDSVRCEGKASSSGAGIGGAVMGVGFDAGTFQKTPLGKATNKVIAQAVTFVIEKMKSIPWQGNVIMTKENNVYINAGRTSNIKVGDEFVVYKKGEELIDPVSGITLGSETKKIGQVQVASVDEKFSKATAISGDVNNFSRGDLIKLE